MPISSRLNYLGVPLPLSGAFTKGVYGTSSAEILIGGLTNDVFDGKGGADTLIGGLGDDTYLVQARNVSVVELPGTGVDTVKTTTNFVLPDNVENLYVFGFSGYRGTFGTGNALANYIWGDTNPQFLDGAGGNDVLTGGGGSDTFFFKTGSGHDAIDDFQTGPTAAGGDVISLQGYGIYDLEGFKAASTQVGADVVVKLSPTDDITIRNTSVADFTDANVRLPLDRSRLVLTFGDEFSGSSPDFRNPSNLAGKWIPEYGFGGLGSKASHYVGAYTGELQIFVDPSWGGSGTTPLGLNPFAQQDGVLTINSAPVPDQARPFLWNDIDYYSGVLSSKLSFAQTYGYFEIRAQMSGESGGWPTFWLLREKAGALQTAEIDVFEAYGSDLNNIRTTVHSTTLPNGKIGTSTYVADSTTSFHTYGVLWTESKITWYIDATQVYQVDTPSDMHSPMYLTSSLQVGPLGGTPNPADPPSNYKIDYIHAYRLQDSTPALNVVGTSASEALFGGAGDDTLNGAGGIDTLSGGAGDDTYIVDNPREVVNEAPGGGNDTVLTSVSYALGTGQEIEHLVATGSAAVSLTGNAFSGELVGNGASNTLDSGSAAVAHQLVGGGGNDTFLVRNAGDAASEGAGGGYDTVKTSLGAYTLPANVEVLAYTGTGDFRGTGNASSNLIMGGAGNDTLDGGGGADRLVGGKGNDVYKVDSASDAVVENPGEGTDTQIASVSTKAAANVEILWYSGAGAFNGHANDTGTEIHGGALGDTLAGGAGADELFGGGGADLLSGGAGADTFHFNLPGGAAVRITDFAHDEDHLALDANAFGVQSLADLSFVTGAAASAPAGEPALVYDPAGKLYWDPTGGTPSDRVLIATFDKAPLLTMSDFIVA